MQYIDQMVSSYGTRTLSPTAGIGGLTYPGAVTIGETYDVIYYAENKTASPLQLFGKILDSNDAIVANSYWTQIVEAGQQHQSQVTMPALPENGFTGTIVVGHIADGGTTWGIPPAIIAIPLALIISAFILYKR